MHLLLNSLGRWLLGRKTRKICWMNDWSSPHPHTCQPPLMQGLRIWASLKPAMQSNIALNFRSSCLHSWDYRSLPPFLCVSHMLEKYPTNGATTPTLQLFLVLVKRFTLRQALPLFPVLELRHSMKSHIKGHPHGKQNTALGAQPIGFRIWWHWLRCVTLGGGHLPSRN